MKSYRVAQLNRQYHALAALAGKQDSPNAWEIGESLYKRLRRVELAASCAAEAYCSVPNFDWETAKENVIKKVARIFGGSLPAGFFVNGDPRGYALKINAGNEAGMTYHPEYIPEGLHRDWGGYGILAPEF